MRARRGRSPVLFSLRLSGGSDRPVRRELRSEGLRRRGASRSRSGKRGRKVPDEVREIAHGEGAEGETDLSPAIRGGIRIQVEGKEDELAPKFPESP